MEGEEFEQVTDLVAVSVNPLKMRGVHAKAGLYYCGECDTEWVRLRHELKKIDGAERSGPIHDNFSDESGPEVP